MSDIKMLSVGNGEYININYISSIIITNNKVYIAVIGRKTLIKTDLSMVEDFIDIIGVAEDIDNLSE